MPLYEFICPSCEHKFTKLCGMSENGANLECPICNNKPVTKVFSTFATSGFSAAGGATSCSSSCVSRGPFR